jgi:demethylmenaquinone methyltransferase/2-methoxy-6-polyprenyl-1,4-benzoquinol methylase
MSNEDMVTRLMPEDPNAIARALFTGLPRRYETLAEVLSFGQNGRWQREAVSHVVPAASGRVLDLATGTTRIARRIADHSVADVTGVDLTEDMLRQGSHSVARAGQAERIRLVAGRAEQLPFPDATFDGATFSYLLRYVADPEATLRELARVVKPGSPVASLEFFVPPARFWRFWWCLYTRGVLPIAGLLTGGPHWYRVGRFLGPSISGHYRRYPLSWTVAAWRRAGFVDVDTRVMSLGGGVVMWGSRGDG